MDGISFFFVQDLITFQFSLKQIPRELIIRIIYKALPYKTFAISILMIVFAAGLFTYVSQLSVILYILLHYRRQCLRDYIWSVQRPGAPLIHAALVELICFLI